MNQSGTVIIKGAEHPGERRQDGVYYQVSETAWKRAPRNAVFVGGVRTALRKPVVPEGHHCVNPAALTGELGEYAQQWWADTRQAIADGNQQRADELKIAYHNKVCGQA